MSAGIDDKGTESRVASKGFGVLIVAFLMLLVLDLMLRGSSKFSPTLEQRIVDIQSPDILSNKLKYLSRHSGPSIVVIGDSVVYGETMASHGDNQWRSHTIDRKIETRLNGAGLSDVLVLNLGLNGAVPLDMERVAYAAMAAGADMIVMDASIRSFSEDFEAPDNQYSRQWLRDYPSGAGNVASDQWELFRRRGTLQSAGGGPLSARLKSGFDALNKRFFSSNEGGLNQDDALLLTLKARKRYATANLRAYNPQKAAMSRIVSTSNDLEIPLVVFYATENPDLIDQIIPADRRTSLVSSLEAVIVDEHSDFVGPLNIPGELYLDQVHLNSAGYDILTNALVEPILNLGVTDRNDAASYSASDIIDRYYRQPPQKNFATTPDAPVWSGHPIALFDGVGPFRKGGRLERENLQVQAVRSSPIDADTLALHTGSGQSFLRWWPANSPLVPAPAVFYLNVVNFGNVSDLTLGLTFFDGSGVQIPIKGDMSKVSGPNSEKMDVHDAFSNGKVDLSTYSGRLIKSIGLYAFGSDIETLRGEVSSVPLVVKNAGFKVHHEDTQDAANDVTVLGQVGGNDFSGDVVVRDSSGQIVMTTKANQDGRFVLSNLSANSLVSVFYKSSSGQKFYSEYGRWARLPSGVISAHVNAAPTGLRGVTFNDSAFRDPQIVQNNNGSRKGVEGSRMPYAPSVWLGYRNVPNEYISTVYANNLGYFDQDRFYKEAPKNCYRIVWVGTSGIEALQSTIANRHSTLLEEELGVLLKRCVEVIAAAPSITLRDKPKVEALISSFQPDLFMFFTNAPDFELLNPEYHFLSRGWDPEHSAQASFVKKHNGQLEWRPAAADYNQYVTTAPRPNLNGVALTASLYTPEAIRDKKAQTVFDMFKDIANSYSKAFPDTKFAVEITTQQAVCSSREAWRCDLINRDADGVSFSISPDSFVNNVKQACQETEFICLGPKTPNKTDADFPRLMYMFDSHFTPHGHQWVAEELARELSVSLVER